MTNKMYNQPFNSSAYVYTVFSFYEFLRRNKSLLIFVCVIALSIYGIRIFNFNISLDTDTYLMDGSHFNKVWNPSEGRWGYALLQYLFELGDLKLNVFFANFISIIFLVLSNFVWLYLIESYWNDLSKFSSFTFSLFYISSSIWCEMIYFTMSAAEMMFSLVLCPICVMLTFYSLRDKRFYIITLLCTAFLIALHQPIFTMYVEGIFIAYILIEENNSSILRSTRMVGGGAGCCELLLIMLLSFLTYILLNQIFLKFIYKVDMADYPLSVLKSGLNSSFEQILKGVRLYLYSIFIGNNAITNYFFQHALAGVLNNVPFIFNHGSPILLLSAILIIFSIIKSKRFKNVLYVLSWCGVIFCLIAVNIARGGMGQERYLYAVPLFSGFAVMYATSNIKHAKMKVLWLLLCLFFGYSQIYGSSFMITSDQKRYELDQWLSREINHRIWQIGGKTGDALLIMGNYDFYYGDSYLYGEVIGRATPMDIVEMLRIESAFKTAPFFMQTQGFNYSGIDENDPRIDKCRKYAQSMPSFPHDGCVQKYEGVVIVKLSDFAYADKETSD